MELFPRLLTLSSIYSKSTSDTKIHNTSFESSGCGQYNSRRTGAWQPQEVATSFFPKKYTFHKQWAWQAPDNAVPFFFQNLKVHYQGFQMRYHLFLCYHLVLIEFEENQNLCLKHVIAIYCHRIYISQIYGRIPINIHVL